MVNGAPGGCRDRRNALYTCMAIILVHERTAEAQVVVRVRLVRRFTLYVGGAETNSAVAVRCGSPRWPRSSRWCRPARATRSRR